MSEKKRILGMSQADKARLLHAMQQRNSDQSLASRDVSHLVSPDLLRFDTLPAYTQILVQKAVAQRLGIEEPFYVCHDGLSQAIATIQGKRYTNFSCYDYLGLNGDSRILASLSASAQKYGFSASASRLTAGERPPHRALEKRIAALYETEECLSFVSGHATNMSTIATLFGPQDVIFHDKASHNSLIMGAKLSGAARFAFPNNDIDSLRSLLSEHRFSFHRALIVTEGLFGMDGVICHLPDLVALKKEFGCFLMVDEAHSMGNLGL
ncbi:MAG: aminotransferase class I/II-fold pyridoxal phosphate-dependent enzyme, partial [Desulfovibrio sp.]|nr:aminotransferase class I/II-fold pyridoxal phosphate-dependent enzyme [Desulfovibrio sp.]